ncbi:MAG: hypothetical protein SFX73_37185 [Kofleriaceae bacterium]|nr:hypothetical protein [Kofleriaceae bacterium]
MADPVRSLRVASTLADRFRAALKPGKLSTTELELVYGEAQEIYLEIWRYLDEARTALIDMARDVSAFDALRMAELGHLGVADIDATAQLDYMALMLGRLRIHAVKTATFNTAGHKRTVAACRALMTAMPEVDWAARVREEDREITSAGSLHASKWSGSAKAIAIAFGLAGVASGVYFLATCAPTEKVARAPRMWSATEEAREAAASAARRAERKAKLARIQELRRQYRGSCDPSLLPELAQAMRDVGHHSDAALVGAEACTPRRPECDGVQTDIRMRVAQQLHLDPFLMALECEGIVVADATRREPAFAVTVGADGNRLRGVVSRDGARDLVAFGPAPADARLVKRGDLDLDDLDELVFASERALFVTRIVGGAFVDVQGPTHGRACEADITIVRADNAGRNRLEVTSFETKRGCLPEGPHVYVLRNDALVEEWDAPISQ